MADEAPEWIELIPAGKFSAVDGRGPFQNDKPDAIVEASMARMPEVGLVLDYDHSTDLAAPEGRPAPAAGWLKEFRVDDHGAIFARVEWTAEAADAIKAKKYRYISPVFEHNKDGQVSCILRAALTNNPALINLAAIAAAEVETMTQYAYTDSDGKGHLPIYDAPHVRNALARYNQTHFESDAKANSAWSAIKSAAKKFGIEVGDESKPKHKVEEPSPGYKKEEAASDDGPKNPYMPKKDEEEMGRRPRMSHIIGAVEDAHPNISHKTLMKIARAIADDSDEDEEASGLDFGKWAGEEEDEHKGDDGPPASRMKRREEMAKRDEDEEEEMARRKDENEEAMLRRKDEFARKREEMAARHRSEDEAMARRHTEEMAACRDETMRSECGARYMKAKEDMARRHKDEDEAMAAGLEKIKGNPIVPSAKPKGQGSHDMGGREVIGHPGGAKEMSAARMAALVSQHPLVLGLKEELADMRTAYARDTAARRVDQAIREGRLIPAQRDWGIEYCTSSPDNFAKFVNAQPRIVKQGADGLFESRIGEPKADALTDREFTICSNLGLPGLHGPDSYVQKFIAAKHDREANRSKQD